MLSVEQQHKSRLVLIGSLFSDRNQEENQSPQKRLCLHGSVKLLKKLALSPVSTNCLKWPQFAELTALTSLQIYGNSCISCNDAFIALAAKLHNLKVCQVDNPENKVPQNLTPCLPPHAWEFLPYQRWNSRHATGYVKPPFWSWCDCLKRCDGLGLYPHVLRVGTTKSPLTRHGDENLVVIG